LSTHLRLGLPSGLFPSGFDGYVNIASETIRENIKFSAKHSLGHYEPKKNKSWFDEGCSKLLEQGKQAKLQWLQHPSEINGDNLNLITRETSRHFSEKKRGNI
jgi:hypothetical protein